MSREIFPKPVITCHLCLRYIVSNTDYKTLPFVQLLYVPLRLKKKAFKLFIIKSVS